MSRLNKKNGALRGVTLAYSENESFIWDTDNPVLGWVVYGKNGHKFVLNFDVENTRAEIVLPRKTLVRILKAIDAQDVLSTGV